MVLEDGVGQFRLLVRDRDAKFTAHTAPWGRHRPLRLASQLSWHRLEGSCGEIGSVG
jgi:hypothetical protein